MPQRTSPSPSSRPVRRHDRRDGQDIADIYEARLLAQGLRSDDFVALRSSTDLPQMPNITPIRFGRGAEQATLLPIAEAEDEPTLTDETSNETDDLPADADTLEPTSGS